MRSRLQSCLLGLTVFAFFAGVSSAYSQGLTGQISGTVVDASSAVLPGVTVTVTNEATQVTREVTSNPDGTFVVPDLLAGTYGVKASLPGFKTFEQKGVVLGATERVALHAITLSVGQLEETVSVTAETPLVQTQSAARSGVINRRQLDDIALKGRDFAGTLKFLPGVIDTGTRDAPGNGSLGGLSINGRSSFNFNMDGITQKDTGANGGNFAAPALDSIAEIRVQTSNFQAEYGRSSGATISVITRSGSGNFHGSGAYYYRDKSLNGNEYQRRQQGLIDPAPYSYKNEAWTLGGPLSPSRQKLFFFWSQDLLQRTDTGAVNFRRVPTALERAGDFSQTRDNLGRLIFIRDPLLAGACNSVTGGPACFAGNKILAGRLDPLGQALLNLLPMPNATDPAGVYNYTYQSVTDHPRNDQILRVDWNVAPKTTFYSRLQFGNEYTAGCCPLGANGSGQNSSVPQLLTKYNIRTWGIVNTLLHNLNNSTFLEATVGLNWAHQQVSPLDLLDQNVRSKVLPGLPQFFPNANPMSLIPTASFSGGLPTTSTAGTAALGFESRFPFYGYDRIWNFSGNVTKVSGPHNMKAGLFIERTERPAARSSSFNGTFSFNTDNANPLNTNIGFANALIGGVTQYTESTTHPIAHGQFYNFEWYAQDNWRLAPKFTVDAGVRFYKILPTHSVGDQVAMFDPTTWTAANAPALYQPVVVGGVRQARNPATGQLLPAVYIGRIVSGVGNPYDGMQYFDETVMNNPGIKVAPRLGFAWDVTGDGRTAVRGGAGVFYDRFADDIILSLVEMPGLLDTRTTNYTTINSLLTNPLTAAPQNADYIPAFKPPVVYNWSLGVQRELPLRMAADVAYVGNAARDQYSTGGAPTNNATFNGRPYGYRFLSTSLDRTNVVNGQAQPLPNDLLRPYPGMASVTGRMFVGYGDYHALQFAVNRRPSNGFAFGVSYTRQLANRNLVAVDPFLTPDQERDRYYNSNGKRPHTLVVNYSYELPSLGRKWNSGIVKAVLDNWQVTGVTSILSGTYGPISYANTPFTNVPTGTLLGTGAIDAPTAGGGSATLGGSRVDIVCDPSLPSSERRLTRQFRTECVQPASDALHLGNAKGDELLGPGYMNWDISFFKNIPMTGGRRLQLRVELYNAFNTDQFTAVDTAAQFDYQTGKQVSTTFGALTGATNPARRIQLGARFTF